jgi:predicted Zn-dependent peptidase
MNWDPYSEFRSTTLENGLTIHALQMQRPWQRVGFVIHSGALQDPIGKEGMAHFVEHLVSENCSLSNQDLINMFRKVGGSCMLGNVNYWRTHYSFYIPLKETIMKKALSLFGQMLISSKLEKNIERERDVIINEFNKKYPILALHDLCMHEQRVLFKDHPLERMLSAIGTPFAIKEINKIDLQHYYDMHYTPANISLVTVGGYSLDEIVGFISKTPFSLKKMGSRVEYAALNSFLPLNENRYVLKTSAVIGSTVNSAGYESSAKIPLSINRSALRMICLMLKELLVRELREKFAWTYAVNTDWDNYREFYLFSITVSSFAVTAIDSIEEKIEAVILSVYKNRKLFNKIRKERMVRLFILDQNTANIMDDCMQDIAVDNRVVTLAEHYKSFSQLTFDEVCSLIPYLSTENRWTLIKIP